MIRLATFTFATLAFVGGACADTPVERGSYLVNTIMTCGNCHSPKGPPDAVAGKDFSGGLRFDDRRSTSPHRTSRPTRRPASARGAMPISRRLCSMA